MRYTLFPFLLSMCLMGTFLHLTTSHVEAQAVAEVVAQMDAGVGDVAAQAASVKAPALPVVDVKNPPDPIAQPATTWQRIVDWSKRSKWIGISLALLIVATAWRKRMQPGPKDTPLVGWRAMSIAIATGLVATCGPLVEVGMGTGGWTAVMMGAAMAIGLMIERFNPPKAGAVKPG